MPAYLCQPGIGSPEPWKHGIQVYGRPFPMDQASSAKSGEAADSSASHSTDAISNPFGSDRMRFGAESSDPINNENVSGGSSKNGLTIRRIRHSEVVLADDVCAAFDRYWLRLRWPGKKGGFAGYIELGRIDDPIFTTPGGTFLSFRFFFSLLFLHCNLKLTVKYYWTRSR